MRTIFDIVNDINSFVAGLPSIRKMDSHDKVIFHDAMVKFAAKVAEVFPKGVDSYECPGDALLELKGVYYDLSRMHLKYLLRAKEKIWGEYIRYDSDIKYCFKVADYSTLRGAAVHAMKSAVSASAKGKELRYKILKEHIDNIVKMNKAIDDSRDSCRRKICRAKIKHWWNVLGGIIAFFLIAAIMPMLTTVKWSEVGQTGLAIFIKKILSIMSSTILQDGF